MGISRRKRGARMKVHEYQAKELLREYGVPVPRGCAIQGEKEAHAAVHALAEGRLVVKAQIHAGGRGKGGGVKLAHSLDELQILAGQMLGMTLVTHQTGPEGRLVRRVLIEEACDIERELYLAVVLERESGCLVVIASAEGGTEIEELAATRPERIHRVSVSPGAGLEPYQARGLAFALGLQGNVALQFATVAVKLCRLFLEKDCSLVEINPLVVTPEGAVLALDAKLNFDANALHRHPEIVALRDEGEEHPSEVEAERHGLSYIRLDGDIGCMVNGAGLAMATMDIIQDCGGRPANFLDVGGGTNRARVAAGLRIILGDGVRAIFVNIFGGIVRCDVVAEGIVAALQEIAIEVPLVVRLEGTNRDEGDAILAASGLPILRAGDIRDGARKAVEAARRG